MKTVTFRQLRHLWPIYLLIVPALGLILTFSYYPAASAVYHSFYRWNGDEISEWVGTANFSRAFQDPVLGQAFVLVSMFIAANLVKMVPSIVTAVVIHRLTSDRARYIYRVAFVIPMIIPGMVWLLVWKYFYNPQVGVLNRLLYATGLMDALNWLDTVMPALSQALTPYVVKYLSGPLGSLWGLGLFGAVILAFTSAGLKGVAKGWLWWIALLVGAWFAWGPLRGALILAGAGVFIELIRARPLGRSALIWTSRLVLIAFAVLVLASAVWTEPTKAFGSVSPPAWLSSDKLIRPALIFWGFPWVGVISVLLYLSGLGNIDQSVYEAADIDGCGWFRKFWNIELPLIATQVRLNLVLMIIGTLMMWGNAFILLGDTGGPGGVGMLPGLYMFHKAFTVAEVGYACAIGLLLFLLIVYLTVINNRYVRVSR